MKPLVHVYGHVIAGAYVAAHEFQFAETEDVDHKHAAHQAPATPTCVLS
jgi:hypothetical protein